jgi:hypothetical protein
MTSSHYNSWWSHPFCGLYYYDPTDDGPECEVITRILARHPLYVAGIEKQMIFDERLRLIRSYGWRTL